MSNNFPNIEKKKKYIYNIYIYNYLLIFPFWGVYLSAVLICSFVLELIILFYDGLCFYIIIWS